MTIRSRPLGFIADIVKEFGGAAKEGLKAYYRGGAHVPASITKIPASGSIGILDFEGASNTSAGTQNYDKAGTYQFIVPLYTTMNVSVSGGSGGSGSSAWDAQPANVVGSGNPGTAGSDSHFLGVAGGAGAGGAGCIGGGRYTGTVPPKGANGNASGGDTTTPGGGVKGAPHGELFFGNATSAGGEGGDAGLAMKKFTAGQADAPVAGSTITVTVGAGGLGGPVLGNVGLPGHDGYVHISWS